MPELIEPPPQTKANRFGPPGPRGGFPRGGPGGPGRPGGFGPGAFPPGPPMGMSSDIVEQMERDYQAMRQSYGDKTAAILVTGLPMGGDPSTREVMEAISGRIKELAPETASGKGGGHRRPVRDRRRAGQRHPGPGHRHRFRRGHGEGVAHRGQARREMGGQGPAAPGRAEARAVGRAIPAGRAGDPPGGRHSSRDR